jgi:hypothetical protein
VAAMAPKRMEVLIEGMMNVVISDRGKDDLAKRTEASSYYRILKKKVYKLDSLKERTRSKQCSRMRRV